MTRMNGSSSRNRFCRFVLMLCFTLLVKILILVFCTGYFGIFSLFYAPLLFSFSSSSSFSFSSSSLSFSFLSPLNHFCYFVTAGYWGTYANIPGFEPVRISTNFAGSKRARGREKHGPVFAKMKRRTFVGQQCVLCLKSFPRKYFRV